MSAAPTILQEQVARKEEKDVSPAAHSLAEQVNAQINGTGGTPDKELASTLLRSLLEPAFLLFDTTERLQGHEEGDSECDRRAKLLTIAKAAPRIQRTLASLQSNLERVASEGMLQLKASNQMLNQMQTMLEKFDDVGLEGDNLLFAITPDVILETADPDCQQSFNLGRFKITYPLRLLSDGRADTNAFRARALDPLWCVRSEDLCHPHVQDDVICMGEGANSIHTSLKTQSIAEAFLLVKAILNTYNPRSPYSPLENWTTEFGTCTYCNARMETEELHECPCCGSYICNGCQSTGKAKCSYCGNTICKRCLSERLFEECGCTVPVCRECDSSGSRCVVCQAPICATHSNGVYCSSCKEGLASIAADIKVEMERHTQRQAQERTLSGEDTNGQEERQEGSWTTGPDGAPLVDESEQQGDNGDQHPENPIGQGIVGRRIQGFTDGPGQREPRAVQDEFPIREGEDPGPHLRRTGFLPS